MAAGRVVFHPRGRDGVVGAGRCSSPSLRRFPGGSDQMSPRGAAAVTSVPPGEIWGVLGTGWAAAASVTALGGTRSAVPWVPPPAAVSLYPALEQGQWSQVWLRPPPPRLWPRGGGCSPLCVPPPLLCPAECRLPGAGGCWATGFCFCKVVEEEEGAGAATEGLGEG